MKWIMRTMMMRRMMRTMMMMMMMMSAKGSASGSRMCHFFLHALSSSFCLQFDGLEDISMSEGVSGFHVKLLLLHRVLHLVMGGFDLKIIMSHFVSISDSDQDRHLVSFQFSPC